MTNDSIGIHFNIEFIGKPTVTMPNIIEITKTKIADVTDYGT